jgi:hypothetical protein
MKERRDMIKDLEAHGCHVDAAMKRCVLLLIHSRWLRMLGTLKYNRRRASWIIKLTGPFHWFSSYRPLEMLPPGWLDEESEDSESDSDSSEGSDEDDDEGEEEEEDDEEAERSSGSPEAAQGNQNSR